MEIQQFSFGKNMNKMLFLLASQLLKKFFFAAL